MRTITGTDNSELLNGSSAADKIFGRGGNDTITGEGGDYLFFGRDDTIFGGDGNDSITGNDGSDHLWGGAGDDIIEDVAGDNTVKGGPGNDTIYAIGTMEGGPGNDVFEHTGMLTGDVYVFKTGDGQDVITDYGSNRAQGASFLEEDKLQLGPGIRPSDVKLARSGNDMVFRFGGDDQITVKHWFDQENTYYIEWLQFANGTVWWDLSQLMLLVPEAYSGTANADKLAGWGGIDLIQGGGGNDILRGYGGNDTLDGGDGNDRLDGGIGKDHLSGGWGADKLIGGAGADMIIGGEGNDTLVGDAGSDTLEGGGGTDKLTGGIGNDVFRFTAWTDLGLDTTSDTITNFARWHDKIDLSLLDASDTEAGDQAFSLVSTDSFGSAAGQVSYANGVVSINTDTDAAAEYAIKLVGTVPATLTADNFVL